MVSCVNINKTELFYDDKWSIGNLNEYHQYILNNLMVFLKNNNIPYSVNFGCKSLVKDINLDFQYEHTIIKHQDSYICQIHRFDYLIRCDSVFEYSNANLNHIKNFTEFKPYMNVSYYYPPLIYDISDSNNRLKDCLTIHNSTERRVKIHNKVNMDYYHIVCPGNLYDKNIMKNVMDGYKILVNIHQNDTNQTLEELRVLPSLLTGILVVSEDVPYKEHIPYHKHIIWSSYDDLPNTINDVLNNYDTYREKYLKDLKKTILNIKNKSDNVLMNIFKKYIQ